MKYLFVEKYDSKYKIKDKEVACFSRSEMKDQHPDGNYQIVGETKKKNRKKVLDTIELGGETLNVSEPGKHSKLLYKRAGYIRVSENGDYIALLKLRWMILWLLFGILLAGITTGLLLWLLPGGSGDPVVPPPVPPVEDTDTVYIFLPNGIVDYRITSDISGLEGAEAELYMTHDGKEDIIHRQKLTVTEGDIESGALDFTSLTFELLIGDYDGRIALTMPDGSAGELKVRVLVRSSRTGEMTIGYSDQITADKSSGKVTLLYEHGENATHDVILQAILIKDGREILLAQSDVVHAGDVIKELPLEKAAKKSISSGKYDGWLRVYIVSGKGAAADTATDIEMHVTVK